MEPSQSGEAPLTFGKYRLHRLIARGGMGEVYLASLVGEFGFEKRLVVKTILPELAAKPRFIELFAAEAKTAVALSHGNIVPIYELGRSDDTFYIAMGYVDGPSVAQVLQAFEIAEAAPELATALFIVREVLTGLAYAHTPEPGREAVVHRDISPRNVLVDRSGQVRIVDFGIALPAQVKVNIKAGSIGYTAPEQARAAAADPRADVFSVGCLLYELITTERAFPKEGVWISPDMSAIPDAVRDVLTRAISLDPAARPEDASAFLEDLRPAFAAHATTYSDHQLAKMLRELFPDGWEAKKSAREGNITPTPHTKRRETQTFATRLTVVKDDDEDDEDGDGEAPAVQGKRQSAAETASDGPAGSAVSSSLDVPQTRASAQPEPKRRPVWLWAGIAAITAAAGVFVLTRPGLFAVTRQPDPPPRQVDAKVQTTAATPVEPPPVEASVPDPVPPPPDPIEQVYVLTVDPPDAAVVVGGKPLTGTSPYAIDLPSSGNLTVRVEKDGFGPQTHVIHAGQPGSADIKLTAKPKARGHISVFAQSVSWAEVVVDRKKRGVTPLKRLELSEGPHKVVVRCVPDVCPSPRVLLTKTVKVKAGETTKVTAQ